jgi:hypothetical protein
MRLYVPLAADALNRLRKLALRERRRPQDQAALLLEDALTLAGHQDPVLRLVEPKPEEAPNEREGGDAS